MTEPFVCESVTVQGAAIGLTAAVFAPAGDRGAERAVLTVEGGDIRWWATGVDPTAADGHLAIAGDVILLEGPNTLRQFRAIRAGAVDGKLQVSYER